jgi:hypothetical protein
VPAFFSKAMIICDPKLLLEFKEYDGELSWLVQLADLIYAGNSLTPNGGKQNLLKCWYFCYLDQWQDLFSPFQM